NHRGRAGRMGRAMGLEPTTPGTTTRCSHQLSYARRKVVRGRLAENEASPARDGECGSRWWRRASSAAPPLAPTIFDAKLILSDVLMKIAHGRKGPYTPLRHQILFASERIALMLQLAQAMSRLGTESAFEVLARAKALEAKGKSVINLGIGQPDFLTPPHIVEAAVKALRDGQHGYTPANGIPQLREAVAADLHRRHGVTVDPGCVLIVPGGKVTMFFAILMFGEAGSEIMYPNPGFPIYESAINFS